VIKAKNGLEVLELSQSAQPDLIILDVMLPDISGFNVCARLRETSDAPIIFLSALGDDYYHTFGYRVGCDDYIAKPFKASILAMKAKRMLGKGNRPDYPIYH